MTDKELRDQAVAELKLTTAGWLKPKGQQNYPSGTAPATTHWGKAMSLLGQIGQAAPPPPPPPPPPNLILDEQWNSIDPARWAKKWRWGGDTYQGGSTVQIEAVRDANTFTQNGILNLVCKREDTTSFEGYPVKFTSGIVQSDRVYPGPFGFTFTYGKIEARIKAAPGPGMWSCLWLCEADYNSPCYEEVDIVEIVGSDIKRAHFNLHRRDLGINVGTSYSHSASLADDFHVYGLEWRQGFLSWTFDGVEKLRTTQGVPKLPAYIMCNLQVGGAGSWAGTPPLDGSTLPSAMQVDYIRISP